MLDAVPPWVSVVREWWAFILILLGFLLWLGRTVIKTNKKLEQIDKVKIHDERIKQIDDKVVDINHKVGVIADKLDQHITKQDGDISAMMTLLLEISEAVKSDPEKGETIQKAHKDFQKHLVKRKES